jgi:outer membrane protein assembly factor BamB
VAVGGRVYTQFQSRTGQYVLCLDADTGAEVWRQRVDWLWQIEGAYPGPYATPTWHAGRLYYATPTGLVGCLDAADGRTLWSVDVRKQFRGKGTEFGYAATPLIEDGRVIVPVGGPHASVVALDAGNGATVWTAGDDQASYCPVYPITFHGRRRIVAFLRNSLVIHDPVTGKQLWRQELSADYDEHSAWPLFAEPHLLIASPFRVGSRLYRLEESEAGVSGREVWANRELSNDVCSSVLIDGHVYGFDLHQLQASAHRASRGRFKCLDFATGTVRWETDTVGQATVLAADGKLILLNDTGTLMLARVSPTTYEELARARVLDGGLCWTPPTLWHGRLFVRNHSRAVCLFLGRPTDLDPNRALPPAPSPSPWQHFDWTWLLSVEPDHPHDAPSTAELLRWFGWCVFGVFTVAGIVAGLVRLMTRTATWVRAAYATTAFLLGLAGTTVFSSATGVFVITWPASLYVAFRLTLAASLWTEARLAARGVLLLFLVLCYGYYRLCLAVGYVMAWGFLAGFPLAVPAAIAAVRIRHLWLRVLLDGVGFTVYFWASGMLPAWKARWFD